MGNMDHPDEPFSDLEGDDGSDVSFDDNFVIVVARPAIPAVSEDEDSDVEKMKEEVLPGLEATMRADNTWGTRLAAVASTYKDIALLIYPEKSKLKDMVSFLAAETSKLQAQMKCVGPADYVNFDERLLALEKHARTIIHEFRTDPNWTKIFVPKMAAMKRLIAMGAMGDDAGQD
jgi:hypothetical protein